MNAESESSKKVPTQNDKCEGYPTYSKFNDTVIDNIVKLMKAKNITQDNLASKISKLFPNANPKLDQSLISKIKNRKRGLDAYILYEIATALEVSVEELISASTSCSSNNEFNNSVITNIRELISLNSPEISEEKLGEIVGLTQYDVGKCMRGSDTFTLEQISKIADYFSVSVDYLMGRNTYSNFVVCKMISDLILNDALAYEIKEKSEDVWKYPCGDRSVYEQVKDDRIGIIQLRVDEEEPFCEKFSEIIDYLTFYFPKCKKLSDDEETHYHDLLEFESHGNLNSDNVIINHFLEKFTNALNLKEKGIINEDEFKDRVDTVFSEVMQFSFDEKNRKFCGVFFPKFED